MLAFDLPAGLTPLDMVALFWMIALWFGMGWHIERSPWAASGVSAAMNRRRAQWMRVFAGREMRMVDTQILTALQNGAAFFASTSLLAVGGVVAMLGQADRLAVLAQDLPFSDAAPRALLETKLFAPLVFAALAFLKFAWAHRLYGYNAILLGATPVEGPAERLQSAIDSAAGLNISAGRSFNRGLRGLYFALGALAWLLGPLALIGATTLVALMLHRREFRSESRLNILRAEDIEKITRPS